MPTILCEQVYREVIFFEDENALNRFKENNFEFSAQASAIVIKAHAIANVKYRERVIGFQSAKGWRTL